MTVTTGKAVAKMPPRLTLKTAVPRGTTGDRTGHLNGCLRSSLMTVFTKTVS